MKFKQCKQYKVTLTDHSLIKLPLYSITNEKVIIFPNVSFTLKICGHDNDFSNPITNLNPNK